MAMSITRPVETSSAISGPAEGARVNQQNIQVYAVVRIDNFLLPFSEPGILDDNIITIHSVLPTAEEARSEVERLSNLRDPDSSGSVRYVWRVTRFFPEGRDAAV